MRIDIWGRQKDCEYMADVVISNACDDGFKVVHGYDWMPNVSPTEGVIVLELERAHPKKKRDEE